MIELIPKQLRSQNQ